MKYEYIYQLECGCDGITEFTVGIQDTDTDKNPSNFGTCKICNEDYVKKKKIKRRIENEQIVPEDEIEVFE